MADFIHAQGSKTDLEKSELNNFIRSFGLYLNPKVTLKLLTIGLEQVDNIVLECCQKVIEKRNGIMHKGLLDVDPTETEQGVLAVEKMISYLRKMLQNRENENRSSQFLVNLHLNGQVA